MLGRRANGAPIGRRLKELDAMLTAGEGEGSMRKEQSEYRKLLARWQRFDPLPLPAIDRCHFERDGVVIVSKASCKLQRRVGMPRVA
jgi:hypothetical protein